MKSFRLYVTISLLLTFVSTASASSTQDTASTATAELSGIVIDLGSSGDAMFNHDRHEINEGAVFSRESYTAYYGNTVLIIDILSGDIDRNSYQQSVRTDIADSYSHTDWIGGAENPDGFWDMYSGAYKLDYREIAYLDFAHDTNTNLHYGLGVYGAPVTFTNDINWLQNNVTIDGSPLLAHADIETIDDVIAGDSAFEPELVNRSTTTTPDWEESGLVSETEWQSPFSDTSFSWDGDTWKFRFNNDDAIVADSGFTTIRLQTADRRGEVNLHTGDFDMSASEYINAITSDDYLQDLPSTSVLFTVESDNTASAILLQETELGDPTVIISDAWINDAGVLVITDIYASPEDIGEVYTAFWNNVQSNGDFYPLTWTLEEINDLNLD